MERGSSLCRRWCAIGYSPQRVGPSSIAIDVVGLWVAVVVLLSISLGGLRSRAIIVNAVGCSSIRRVHVIQKRAALSRCVILAVHGVQETSEEKQHRLSHSIPSFPGRILPA